MTLVRTLFPACLLGAVSLFGASALADGPQYYTFSTPPTVSDLERVFGLPSSDTVGSRAIVSVATGARLDAPSLEQATPQKPPAKKAQTQKAQPKKPATGASSKPAAQKQRKKAPTQTALIKPTPMPGEWVTERVSFDNDSARVVSSELGVIDAIGSLMKAHPRVRLIVSGHANATGPHFHNDKLSQRRAAAVRNHIARIYAIDPARMELRWMGARDPLPSTHPVDPVNRRVQFGVIRG